VGLGLPAKFVKGPTNRDDARVVFATSKVGCGRTREDMFPKGVFSGSRGKVANSQRKVGISR
jgi:hypothetical protein